MRPSHGFRSSNNTYKCKKKWRTHCSNKRAASSHIFSCSAAKAVLFDPCGAKVWINTINGLIFHFFPSHFPISFSIPIALACSHSHAAPLKAFPFAHSLTYIAYTEHTSHGCDNNSITMFIVYRLLTLTEKIAYKNKNKWERKKNRVRK